MNALCYYLLFFWTKLQASLDLQANLSAADMSCDFMAAAPTRAPPVAIANAIISWDEWKDCIVFKYWHVAEYSPRQRDQNAPPRLLCDPSHLRHYCYLIIHTVNRKVIFIHKGKRNDLDKWYAEPWHGHVMMEEYNGSAVPAMIRFHYLGENPGIRLHELRCVRLEAFLALGIHASQGYPAWCNLVRLSHLENDADFYEFCASRPSLANHLPPDANELPKMLRDL